MIVSTREHSTVRHDLTIKPHQRPYLREIMVGGQMEWRSPTWLNLNQILNEV